MKKIDSQKGFTIIETMISVSLFLVIVMAGIGALLNANLLHQKSQNVRSIMDNLSFVMDDMSRNLRLGYSYQCITGGSIPNDPTPASCALGGGISFIFSLDQSRWIYYVGTTPSGHNGIYKRIKRVGESISDPILLTSEEIIINNISGFSVLGAEPPSQGNRQQPFVTIKLIGDIDYKGIKTPFSLQTSVSQRALDNI